MGKSRNLQPILNSAVPGVPKVAFRSLGTGESPYTHPAINGANFLIRSIINQIMPMQQIRSHQPEALANIKTLHMQSSQVTPEQLEDQQKQKRKQNRNNQNTEEPFHTKTSKKFATQQKERELANQLICRPAQTGGAHEGGSKETLL